jgi:1,4-dihydroxy-2-naphthoyl-CoA hydrolase
MAKDETHDSLINRHDLARTGLLKTLGIEVRELTPEQVVATMPVTPDHHQPLGFLHGGASLALAETVASVGAFLNCPPGMICFGLEINANHVRPVRSGMLSAVGVPLHRGKTTQIWDVRIYNEQDKLICVSRCTVAITAPRQDSDA